MNLEKALNLEFTVKVLNFETNYGNAARQILNDKYSIPEESIFGVSRRIFDKLSTNYHKWNVISDIVLWSDFHKLAANEAKALKLTMSKNFGLTEQSFLEMCTALRNGDETLFETVFLHHTQDCIKYLMKNYTLNHEDAYDVSMDTLIEFRKKLIAGKIGYGNIRFLYTKMASQIYIKSKNKLKRVDGLVYDSESYIPEVELQILERAIEDLGEECQKLLRLNFYEKLSIADIAELQGKNAGSLRKTKQRCLFKLKNLFTKHNQ